MTTCTLHRLLAALSASLCLLAATPAPAQPITDIRSIDRASPDSGVDELWLDLGFNSNRTAGPVVRDGDTASFRHRAAWFSGGAAEFGAMPIPARPWSRTASYSIGFTVNDPQQRGYTLQFESLLAGVVWASGQDVGEARASLPALHASLYEAFVPDPLRLTGLATPEAGVSSDFFPGIEEVVLDVRGRDAVGGYVGTRSFLLTVEVDPLRLEVSALTPLSTREAYLQFGAEPGNPALLAGTYTGGTARSISDLGHFIDVAARFNAAPVPEPATALLLGAGIGLLLLRRRAGTLHA